MRECPYCREILDAKEDAAYLFHWCQEADGREDNEEYQELKELLRMYRPASEMRKEQRFGRVWKNYNYSTMDELLFQPNDMLLSADNIRMIQRWIREGMLPEARKGPQENRNIQGGRKKNADLMRQDKDMQERRTELQEPSVPQPEEGQQKNHYFCLMRNEQDPMDCQMDIACGVRDHIIVMVRRVCPHCFNLVPDDLYRYDVMKIYLVAPPWAGKTSMLYSVYRHKDTFNRVNGRKIKWEAIQDEKVDPYYAAFVQEAKQFEAVQRDLPPTLVHFIPPLFLKFTCESEKNRETVILAIYDNGGEIFLPEESNSEMAREFGAVFNQKIRGMDAVLCMLTLTEKDEVRNDDRYGMELSREKKAELLAKSRVTSEQEQRRIEENPLEQEMTIEETMLRLSGSNAAAGGKSREIFRTLERELGNSDMQEIVRNQYLAVVVSKIDKLIYSTLFQENEKSLLFGEEEEYFTESFRNKKGERDKIMKELLRGDRIPGGQGLLAYDIHKFRDHSFHFIAAYIENEPSLRPIRVEEPLVYCVSDYLIRKKQNSGKGM